MSDGNANENNGDNPCNSLNYGRQIPLYNTHETRERMTTQKAAGQYRPARSNQKRMFNYGRQTKHKYMIKKRQTKPPHAPTDATRQTVQLHTMVGTTQADIARVLNIDEKTLRKYYRDELDLAKAKANATIGGALFNKAKTGDTSAMIFWMKTQAGWREKTDINHTSEDASMSPKAAGIDTSKLSTKALAEIMALHDDQNS